MSKRTDLAAERCKAKNAEIIKNAVGDATAERLTVPENDESGLAAGSYVTIGCDGFTPEGVNGDLCTLLRRELAAMLAGDSFLVVGLGNTAITPDALGPKAAAGVIATRHIFDRAESFGLKGIKQVAVISTGVLGDTGIEAAELVKAAVEKLKPDTVIAIDALAAGSTARLGKTVQLTNAGISPGSGVGNSRKELSLKTLGVPTVAIGVPTVVDSAAFSENGKESGVTMMVTPRDIDSLVQNAAKIISHAVNCALHPTVDSDILLSLAT